MDKNFNFVPYQFWLVSKCIFLLWPFPSVHVQFHLCNYLPYRPRLSFFRAHRGDTWVSRNCFPIRKETCISGYKDFLSYILISIYTILDVFPKKTFIYFIDFFLIFFPTSLNLILLKEKWMILQSLFLFYVNSAFLPLCASISLSIYREEKTDILES